MSDVRRDPPALGKRKKGVKRSQKKKQAVADHLAVPGATEKQETNIGNESVKEPTSKKAKKELPMSGIEIAAVDCKGNFSGQTGSNENLSNKEISTTDPAPARTKVSQGVEKQSPSTSHCSVQYRASKGSGLSDLGLGFDALVRDGALGPRRGSGDGGNTNEDKAKSPKPSNRDVVTAQPGTSRDTATRNETVAVQVETPNVTPACGEVVFQPTPHYNNNIAVQPRTSGMVSTHRPQAPVNPGPSWTNPSRNNGGAVQPGIVPPSPNFNNFPVQPGSRGMAFGYPPPAPVRPGPSGTNPSRSNGGAAPHGIDRSILNSIEVQDFCLTMLRAMTSSSFLPRPGTSRTNPSRSNGGAVRPGIAPPSANFNNFPVRPGSRGMAFGYPPPAPVRPGPSGTNPSRNNGGAVQPGIVPPSPNFNNSPVQPGSRGMAFGYPPPAPVRPGPSGTNPSRSNGGAVRPGPSGTNPSRSNGGAVQPGSSLATRPDVNTDQAVDSSLLGRNKTDDQRVLEELVELVNASERAADSLP